MGSDSLVKKDPISPWDGALTLAPGQSIEVDEKIATDWNRQQQGLRSIRGNILAKSIEIELAIDVLLREFLFPKEWKVNSLLENEIEKARILFDQCFSKNMVLNFGGKIRALRMALEEKQFISNEDQKALLDCLEEIRSVRNLFAHTTISFDPGKKTNGTELKAYVVQNGRKKYLDNEYFDRLNRVYVETIIRTENVTRKLQDRPLERYQISSK